MTLDNTRYTTNFLGNVVKGQGHSAKFFQEIVIAESNRDLRIFDRYIHVYTVAVKTVCSQARYKLVINSPERLERRQEASTCNAFPTATFSSLMYSCHCKLSFRLDCTTFSLTLNMSKMQRRNYIYVAIIIYEFTGYRNCFK